MEWKVEELKLYSEKNNTFINEEKIYNCESELSREEKIEFVDKMQDGKLSYLLSLIDKFNLDKETMPKDRWEYVKTVSLKAWLKRNDTRKLTKDWHTVGEYNMLDSRRHIANNDKGTYDTYEDLVDEVFHRQLKECEKAEYKYFLEHDEYSILKEKFRNKKYDTTFGVNIVTSSDKVWIGDFDSKREITIDELKLLLSKYEELDKLVEEISREIDIKY